MRLSRLRKRFRAGDHEVAVQYDVHTTRTLSTLSVNGQIVTEDHTGAGDDDVFRNHSLEWVLPDGQTLTVEIGPAGTWSYGMHARIGGETCFETHPGRTLGYSERLQRYMVWAGEQNTPEEKARQKAAWKRNWPSLLVDLVLALAFFFVAREFGLVAAAVGGAVAGLVLWVIQRWSRVDLLGGLAVFGIVMGLLSAAFALTFQDERIIQMRGTIMGVVGAVPFLVDGMTGGQRLAGRMARYLTFDIDAARLGVGMGLIGLLSAAMNALAAILLSRDGWLIFTTFLDIPIVMGAFIFVMLWARKGPKARTY